MAFADLLDNFIRISFFRFRQDLAFHNDRLIQSIVIAGFHRKDGKLEGSHSNEQAGEVQSKIRQCFKMANKDVL